MQTGSHSGTHTSDLPQFLIQFARNPIQLMKRPLNITWPACLSLQIGTAMISGAIAGALSHSFWDFAVGLLLFPLTSLIVGFVYSGFIFTFFSLFLSTYLDFQRLHSIVVVALVPYFILHVFSGFLPPMDLIGFALTAILLIVGLVEQFGVARKPVIILVSGISATFFAIWMIAQIRMGGGFTGTRFPSSVGAPTVAPAPGGSGPMGAGSANPTITMPPTTAPQPVTPKDDPNM